MSDLTEFYRQQQRPPEDGVGLALLARLRAAQATKPKHDKSHLDDMGGLMARITARGVADFEAFQAAHPELADDDTVQAKPVRKRRPLVFRERDVTRAIAGHMKAGLSVQRTEIDPSGRIVIVTGQAERIDLAPTEIEVVNEWD